MRALKRSARQAPKVSIILLDWSVRESFHLLHYLRDQEVSRDQFEVILIEYYSRVSAAAERYASDIDTWALLELPEECYYHKHLMYNAGLSLSRGDICVFCDSDAMVKPSFVGAIVEQFEADPAIVLHLDQFRNMRSDLYPFSYPSFDEVLGPGCINNVNGQTRGLRDTVDPLHTRNYGACMCARRGDLLAIGGADEHIDYLGHICGPYDMTFRLVNLGRSERWHASEFLYHTWHPGQAGVANYLGPHDGRHMSTTALEALASGRTEPLAINPAIAVLRSKGIADTVDDTLLETLIPADRAQQWLATHLPPVQQTSHSTSPPVLIREGYKGFNLIRWSGRYYAIPQGEGEFNHDAILGKRYSRAFDADTLSALKVQVDRRGGVSVLRAARRLGGRLYRMAWPLSTTAPEPLASGTTEPLAINPAIAVRHSKGIADTVDDTSLKTLTPADRAQRWPATHLPPVLIREGYRGFNLIRWSGRYYAVPQGEGEFNHEAILGQRYSRAFDADTLSALKVQVDRRGGDSVLRAARRLGGRLYRMARPRHAARK